MAPFSRFCALAFSLGAAKKNRVNQRCVENNNQAWSRHQNKPFQGMRIYHSPKFVASLAAPSDVLDDSLSSSFETPPTADVDLSQLSEMLGATPTDLLSLETCDDGVRGVHVNRNVKENDVLLSIPLDSCLRDDAPPAWFLKAHDDGSSALQPSAWATRLTASLVDKQLHLSSLSKAMGMWLQLLPNANFLRASLPIHWTEETLSSAKCTALELAVDSTYFTRADAIADLSLALQETNVHVNEIKQVCDNALDLVQTRSCRVETNNGTFIRLLAPIFDFINHASTANAVFSLEGEDLVARATTDLNVGDEIFICYGDSAQPQWKCLASYGFVPEYKQQDEDSNVAEVYVHGKRFEVGPSTIPVDLVEAVEAHAESEGFYERPEVEESPETVLTPDIAMRIANRVSEVAFQLLLDSSDPDVELATVYEDAIDEDDEQEEKHQAPEDVTSARLAASLRFAQHRTLLACANGLIDWAEGQLEPAASEE